MLGSIWAISYQDTLPYLLIIGLGSFLIWDIAHCKAWKNSHVLEILLFVALGFFWNYFIMLSASYGKSVLWVICCLYCLCPKSIRKSVINQHQAFYCHNGSSNLSANSFSLYIYGAIYFTTISRFLQKFQSFTTINSPAPSARRVYKEHPLLFLTCGSQAWKASTKLSFLFR